MTDAEIEAAFRAAVEAYRRLPGKIPVAVAIKAMTGFRILPLETDRPDDDALIDRLRQAARSTIARLVANPILSVRANEVGNLFEQRMMDACREAGLAASWPTTAQGGGGRSGYPDLLVHDAAGRPTYVEVKAVGPGQDATTFRSFYISPSDRPKVCFDARHLLIAFSHEHRGNSGGKGVYGARGYKIVDLARVAGGIKFEYQSSNRTLYAADAVVAGESVYAAASFGRILSIVSG